MDNPIYRISFDKKLIRRNWESNILISKPTAKSVVDVFKIVDWPNDNRFITYGLGGQIMIWNNGELILEKDITQDLEKIYTSQNEVLVDEFIKIRVTYGRLIRKSTRDVYLLVLGGVTKFKNDSPYPMTVQDYLLKLDLEDLNIVQSIKCKNTILPCIAFSLNSNLLIAKNYKNNKISVYSENNLRYIETEITTLDKRIFIDDQNDLMVSMFEENIISSYSIENLTPQKQIASNDVLDGKIINYAYSPNSKRIVYTTWNSKRIVVQGENEKYILEVGFLDNEDKFSFSKSGDFLLITNRFQIHIFDLSTKKSVLDVDKYELGEKYNNGYLSIVDALYKSESKKLIVISSNLVIREFDLSHIL